VAKWKVLTREAGAPFRLSPEQKQELLESMAEADRGEFVDVDELMAELDDSD
jgi:predicted transcriptional regulator